MGDAFGEALKSAITSDMFWVMFVPLGEALGLFWIRESVRPRNHPSFLSFFLITMTASFGYPEIESFIPIY